MHEVKLRYWMKELLGDDLSWVEPTRGSIIGRPDALVTMPDKTKLPIELKIWKITKKGLECKMRPAQIRYHYMSWLKKREKTAICYAVDCPIDGWLIFVLNGRYVPQDKYKHDVLNHRMVVCRYDQKIKRSDFFKMINFLWRL